MRQLLGIVLFLLASGTAAQSITLSAEQEQRAYQLGLGLACPQCDGQTINASEADMARLMKDYIRDAILRGDSDADILAFFESRYGAAVILPDGRSGPLRWLPWLLGLAIVLAAGFWIRSGRRAARADLAAEPPW